MDDTLISAQIENAVTAYLEVTESASVEAKMYPLRDEIVIGRQRQDSLDADHFLCIPEQTVSRRHARIRRKGDAFFVEDLHSFNGTYLHGNRLEPGAWSRLRDGDELTVASTQMVFHSLVVPAAESTPSIITAAVDATQFAFEAPPDASAAAAQLTLRKLHAMAQVSIALGSVKDRATLTEKIMNFIFDLFPLAERAFILLKRHEGEPLIPVAARQRDGQILPPDQVRLSRTIIDEVTRKTQSVLSVDTLADRHFGQQDSIVVQAIRCVMCVPLLIEEEVLGLIQVDTTSDPTAFTSQDLEILTGVCAEAAIALKNFRLYQDIERLLDGFVRASVQAIEERDPVTAGHSFRVASYAENLAKAVDRIDIGALRKVRFSADQMREIRYAALLHDFGKVGVREHVLRKEHKLHHADMQLLDQRFQYARACLERDAYRRLAESHLHGDAPADAKARVDAELREEFGRLQAFMDTIHKANEPAIIYTEPPRELREVSMYRYHESDDTESALIGEQELSALSVKRGCLTPEERRQIESHVADSYSFLILIPWTRDLAGVPSIAHGHHEKLDGSGYPMGLRGEQISIQTRILTISDIFDALTAGDRPYKRAVPLDQALDVLAEECRAGHLDSRVFDVFVDYRAWEVA